jgi:hypothetical protein
LVAEAAALEMETEKAVVLGVVLVNMWVILVEPVLLDKVIQELQLQLQAMVPVVVVQVVLVLALMVPAA